MAKKAPKRANKEPKKKSNNERSSELNRVIDNLIKGINSPSNMVLARDLYSSDNWMDDYAAWDDWDDDYDEEGGLDFSVCVGDIDEYIGDGHSRYYKILFTVPLCIYSWEGELAFHVPDIFDNDMQAFSLCQCLADGGFGTRVFYRVITQIGEFLAVEIYGGYVVYCDIPKGSSLMLCTITGIPVGQFTRQKNGEIALFTE